MFTGDSDSLGKGFFNLCASADESTITESGSEALDLGFRHAAYSGFFLTCCCWVPLDSKGEKTWLFGLRAWCLAWF